MRDEGHAARLKGEDFSRPVLAAAIGSGTIALLALGVQPVLLGAMVAEGWLTASELGSVATAEVIGLGLGSAIGPWLLKSGRIRRKTLVLALLLAALDAATIAAHTRLHFEILRGGAGLGEGLLLSLTNLFIVRSRAPDRLNGVFSAVSTIPQAVFAYPILPLVVLPRVGSKGALGLIAILCLGICACALFLNDRVRDRVEVTRTRPLAGLHMLTAVLAIVLQAAAIGGSWVYLPVLGASRHIPPEVVGAAISGNLIFQTVGALFAAWVCRRIPFYAALTAGTLLQLVIIVALASATSAPGYVAASAAFGLLWLGLITFQVRMLVELDPARNFAMLLTALNLVGMSIGPAVAALGVRDADVSGAFWIAAGLMASACALYAATARVTRPRREFSRSPCSIQRN